MSEPRKGLERLADLLPDAARRLGLEEELNLATAMAAWDSVVAERLPEAAGACRLVALQREVGLVQADEPIVGQELRLRSVELLERLRASSGLPIRELRIVVRNV